jgi:hypothetical protein
VVIQCYAGGVLRSLLIDGFESAELVEALKGFVTAKGKPLTVSVSPRGAELSAAKDRLLVVRQRERAQAARQALQADDEAEVPLLVAARIGAAENLAGALAFYLKQRHGVESSTVVSASAERIEFRAVAWRQIEGEELADLSGVWVPVPVAGCVTLREDGGVSAVTGAEPAPEDIAEAKNFALSLVRHGQVHTHMPGQRTRASHEVVTNAQGMRRLVRARAR